MLFSDSWKNEEDIISDKIIADTVNIINFNKDLAIQNQLCIKYISICDYDKTYRYIIFIPFAEFSKIQKNNIDFPYIFIKDFKINVSKDFMQWLFYITRANKTPVVIGKIDDKLSGSWYIFHGDPRITWNICNEMDLTSFERWLYERTLTNSEFKIFIKNPMISKVPFPINDQNLSLTLN